MIEDRVHAAYGRAEIQRLAGSRLRYDPDNVFRMNAEHQAGIVAEIPPGHIEPGVDSVHGGAAVYRPAPAARLVGH